RRNTKFGPVPWFSSAEPFREFFPGTIVWEAPHLRSEISASNSLQATRALGRFESDPGLYALLPPTFDTRTPATDPLPPTRLPGQASLFYGGAPPPGVLAQPDTHARNPDSLPPPLYALPAAHPPPP